MEYHHVDNSNNVEGVHTVQLNPASNGSDGVDVDVVFEPKVQEPASRPSMRRGRPKKVTNPPLSSLNIIQGKDEAEKTWMVGKLVDMQTTNDELVVSALRRSKRLA